MVNNKRLLLKTPTILIAWLAGFSLTCFSQAQADTKWKTWVVNSMSQSNIFKNPTNDQTLKELKTVKEMVAKSDE